MTPFQRIQQAHQQQGLSPQQQQIFGLPMMDQQQPAMGQQPPQPQMPQSGAMSKFNNYARDNSNALIGLGMGILGGRDNSDAMKGGMQGYFGGSQMDTKSKDKNATREYLKAQGHDDTTIDFYMSNPKVMAQALKPKTIDQTGNMKEYNLAVQQGFNGNFLDYERAKQAENTPQGFESYTTESGSMAMRPIEGSPAYMDQQAMAEKDKMAAQSNTAKADDVLYAIGNIRGSNKKSKIGVTGLLGSAASMVPGTEAANVKSSINTIFANLAFDRLSEMRAQSKTGGALGAISERELDLLGAAKTALSQAQTEEQFFSALDRLEQQYLAVVHGEDWASQNSNNDDGPPIQNLIDHYGDM